MLRKCGEDVMLIGPVIMMKAVVDMCYSGVPKVTIQSSQRTGRRRRLFDCLPHICPHVHQKLDACMPQHSAV